MSLKKFNLGCDELCERMISMKRMLLALVLIFAVVCFSACGEKTEKYTDEEGNVKEYTYVTRETSDKFTLFEEALSEMGIGFEKSQKSDGIIAGAKEGRKYTLSSGKTVEIFKFDVKSEAYREVAKTSKLYMEMFDAYIAAAVNDEYAMIPVTDEEMRNLFLNLD